MNLLYNSRITCKSRSSEAGGNGTSVNSHVLDMSGFDSVMFIAKGNSEWASTVANLCLYGSTVSTTAGNHLVQKSTVAAVTASDGTDRLFIVDANRIAAPYRYLWSAITSSSTHGMDFISIQYNSRFGGSTDLIDSTALAKIMAVTAATT